ncbi:MAG: VanW family protein [Clostridia bacterium]|nr:VanW family protein [Clostridia bacterium]
MPTMTRAGYTPPKAEPAKPPKPPKPKKPRKGKRKKKKMGAAAIVSLVIFLAAALVGAATIYVYTQTQPYLAAFCPGTSLAGYPLSGATWENACGLLSQLTDEAIAAWRFEMTYLDEAYVLTAEDVSLKTDADATLDPVWQAGRSGGMLERYVQMLMLRREPQNAEPVIVYDMEPVDAMLERIRADIECEPVDATVSFTPGNSVPFRFTEESVGLKLDTAPLRAQIERAILSLTPGTAQVSPEVVEPSAYAAELQQAIFLRARLTVQLEGSEAEIANASLAADMFSGLCVNVGESCSFNTVVGRRTAEGGYVAAPEPAYGLNVSGVGGGVCQTSTALYRAALMAGLEIADRSAAVRPVTYCDMGQEAAVSDQGLDLVIRNQTDSPLFIATRVYRDGEATYLEVQFIGERLEERYALESQAKETETIEEPVYVRDREGTYATYTDERVPVIDAQPGYEATVERVTLGESGEELARETISHDIYEPVAPAIYVGVTER